MIEETLNPVSTDVAWPVLPEGTTGWTLAGMTKVWVLARMPDGNCAEGLGDTADEAVADARRRWRQWKRGHAGKLAIDGRDYQRRLRNRRRRQ
jgi:hypothetical protein